MASVHHVHGLPIAAEVSGQTVAELEADPEPPVLKEDVGITQLRQVDANPFPFLRQSTLDASYQPSVLERVDTPVAGGDGNSIFPAQLNRRSRAFESRNQDFCRILVGHEA